MKHIELKLFDYKPCAIGGFELVTEGGGPVERDERPFLSRGCSIHVNRLLKQLGLTRVYNLLQDTDYSRTHFTKSLGCIF